MKNKTLKEIVEREVYCTHDSLYKSKSPRRKEYCSKAVHEQGRGVGFYQCGRKGVEVIEGFPFCSQHAKEIRHILGISEVVGTVYVAEFDEGEYSLSEFDYSEKTKNYYTVTEVREIVGNLMFFTGRQKVDSERNGRRKFFERESDAWLWLHQKAEEHYENMGKELDSALKSMNILSSLVREEIWNKEKNK